MRFLGYGEIEVDAHGIRRRKPDAAEKYKKRVFICKLCGWAYSIKYDPKVNCSDIISPYQKMPSKVFPLVLPILTNL